MSIDDATIQLGILYEKQYALDAMLQAKEGRDDLLLTLRATERNIDTFIAELRKWFPAKTARRIVVDACNLILT